MQRFPVEGWAGAFTALERWDGEAHRACIQDLSGCRVKVFSDWGRRVGGVFGVEKFHQYVYGRRFTIVTNHKFLLGRFNQDKASCYCLHPDTALGLFTGRLQLSYRAPVWNPDCQFTESPPIAHKPVSFTSIASGRDGTASFGEFASLREAD